MCDDDCTNLIEEEYRDMDIEKGKAAIFVLRNAVVAVRDCNTVAECWIVKDLEMHIEEIQNEIGGHSYEKHIGDRQAST